MAASATTLDLRRPLGKLYAPARTPVLIDVPTMAFLMVDGRGDPNTSPAYRAAVEALYSVAYAAKFAVRHMSGTDFRVMPLEGLWWVPDGTPFTIEDKSDWQWTAMIMQPEPVTPEIVELARRTAAARKPLAAVERVRLELFTEGLAAQVLHQGGYDEEAPTVARLHRFIAEQGYVPAGRHHEIYLNDPSRTAPGALRTLIRQPVQPD